MGISAREKLTQPVRPPSLVIDVPDERVLNRDAPSCARGVIPRGLEHLVDLPTLVYRDKLIAQIIIWRMERKRKSQGEILLSEAANRRHQPDGRDRDMPL